MVQRLEKGRSCVSYILSAGFQLPRYDGEMLPNLAVLARWVRGLVRMLHCYSDEYGALVEEDHWLHTAHHPRPLLNNAEMSDGSLCLLLSPRPDCRNRPQRRHSRGNFAEMSADVPPPLELRAVGHHKVRERQCIAARLFDER